LRRPWRQEARATRLAESRQHAAQKMLRSLPALGPGRVAWLIARRPTPQRLRGKRPWWAYAGLALGTRARADYRVVDGPRARSRQPALILGLHANHHQARQARCTAAAASALAPPGPGKDF
jgi:hypothetical protein